MKKPTTIMKCQALLFMFCALTSLILCFCASPSDKPVIPELLLEVPPVIPELLPEVPPGSPGQSPASPELNLEPPGPPAPNSTILPNSPQFVVRLPDKNLLCFSIEGFELFTYNLITSSYLVLNGFLNVTSIPVVDGMSQIRGFGDVGMMIKAVDRRIKVGRRYFKHLIYGEKKKAIMEGFGEVDMNKGAIAFSLLNGHSNIESQQSPHEQFRLTLDKPQTDILIISSNGHTFNVYVEDCSGLVGIDMHGLLGQFFHSKVRISTNYKLLHLANNRPVPVQEGPVWSNAGDTYAGKTCWYPAEGEKIIEGEPWEYIVEHIMSTNYKYSLFTRK